MLVSFTIASYLFDGLHESQNVVYQSDAEERAFKKYGERWLGVFSRDDEAINGLKRALVLTGTVMPRLAVGTDDIEGKSDFSDFAGELLRKLIRPIYNRWVCKLGDAFILSQLRNRILGWNSLGIAVSQVRTSPSPQTVPDNYPELPRLISDEIRESADRKMASAAPRLREELGITEILDPSFTAFFAGFGRRLTWGELVHTSYFNNSRVITIIVLHLLQQSQFVGSPEIQDMISKYDNFIIEYYNLCKDCAKVYCSGK